MLGSAPAVCWLRPRTRPRRGNALRPWQIRAELAAELHLAVAELHLAVAELHLAVADY